MLLQDEHRVVRESAALALRGMGRGSTPVIPELITALKDPAGTVRMSAALALGAMGADARAAVPALATALEVPDHSTYDK